MPRLSNDYMDVDLAYILGLIYGRGSIIERGEDSRIKIEFIFKTKELEEVQEITDIDNAIKISFATIRDRIRETLGCEVRTCSEGASSTLLLLFYQKNLSWRIIREFTGGKKNYKTFTIPDYFYEATTDILKEFMIGIADTSGYVRSSNYDLSGRHRIYLQINNKNWILPIQLCYILQKKLNVPVQLIQWGHPNTREPNKINVKRDYKGWAREHQIKIYVEDFLKIGFDFPFKQKLAEKLAEENIKEFDGKTKMCNPYIKKPRTEKPNHPCENSDILPKKLRGKHFNSYFEICLSLGCAQGEKVEGEIEIVDDE